jgi:hypothetical protein
VIQILFIPQTDRNAYMLDLYARALPSAEYRCSMLISSLFLGDGEFNLQQADFHSKLISDARLKGDKRAAGSEFRRLALVKANHDKGIDFLKEMNPACVIVGHDHSSMGLWMVELAKSLGICTITCQEGANFLFESKVPVTLRLKRMLLNIFQKYNYRWYPFPQDRLEFTNAKYAMVWSDHVKRRLESYGKKSDTIFVVGDPRRKKRAKICSSSPAVLFADLPAASHPKGVYNEQLMFILRKKIIDAVTYECKCAVWYKMHPMTREDERAKIVEMCAGNAQVTVISDGVIDDYLQKAPVACITFPSSVISECLALGVPLIEIVPLEFGVTKMLWDPVRDFSAGIAIQTPEEIAAALDQIGAIEWREYYAQQSLKAAEDLCGPLDEKAGERFYKNLKEILTGRLSKNAQP